ncbi:Polyisoprenoid-binding protein YceI [Duganella sp. CF517]|uniref:YceI family protein n=1 Tax=Duganella sp. CF517 TaxID=1881038 RepID=UPI0008CF591F|nr:YceI family protein [Duganella sp. CF517]SEN14900.1 Polyisoprenoid-binding protein YceI [Duganella sp. CF517]
MTHTHTPRKTNTPSTSALRALAGAALMATLAACSPPRAPGDASGAAAPPPPPATTAAAPAPAPSAEHVLRIDSAASLIAVTVRRGGLLARLGHDHVIASRTVSGTVAPALNRADFQFRLDQLTVDEPELRRVAGLEKQPSADAIDGTRTNMLTKVLDAERFPVVSVRAERGAAGEPLRVAITLHGVTRNYAIPVDLRDDNGVMTVGGTVDLNQTDFGLVPFSVMGGAMAVQDKMELRFSLVAK